MNCQVKAASREITFQQKCLRKVGIIAIKLSFDRKADECQYMQALLMRNQFLMNKELGISGENSRFKLRSTEIQPMIPKLWPI